MRAHEIVNTRMNFIKEKNGLLDLILLDEYRIKILRLFTEAFVFRKIFSNGKYSIINTSYSNLQILIAFITINILVWKLISQKKGKKILQFNIIMLIGYLPYLTVLYAAYAYTFNEYEGTKLGDFTRYTSTYIYAWLILLASYVFVNSTPLKKYAFVVLGFVFLCFSPARAFKFFDIRIQKKIPARVTVESKLEPIKKYLVERKKIYFIWQHTNGLEHRIFAYLARPAQVEPWGWSLGTQYGEGDLWTVKATPEDFKDIVQSYDYIFVSTNNEFFWKDFGMLFEKKKQGLFDVKTFPYKLIAEIP